MQGKRETTVRPLYQGMLRIGLSPIMILLATERPNTVLMQADEIDHSNTDYYVRNIKRPPLHLLARNGLGAPPFSKGPHSFPISTQQQPGDPCLHAARPHTRLAANLQNKKDQTARPPGPPPFSVAFVPYSLVPDIPNSGGGGATSLTFENHLKISVKLWWVDGGGGHKPYGELAAGATKKQGSYAQHVWLITNQADKPLGYFVASSAPALAKIIND